MKSQIKYIKNPDYRCWFSRKILRRNRKNWKYKLTETYSVYVGIYGKTIKTKYLWLHDGWLTIFKGYCWDGASGPAIDTKNIMQGSLVHDALYQLMREGLLDIKYRKFADQLLIKMCKADGMWWPRTVWVYAAVRWFGKKYAQPKAA